MASLDLSIQKSTLISSRLRSPSPIPLQSARDTLQAIQRQTTYLQKEIQSLLDAHSIGLLAGLGQEADVDQDASYTSPVAGPIHLPVSSNSSAKSGQSTRSRRAERRPSLSTSRKRLHASLVQLAELKESEVATLEVHRGSLADFLETANALTQKKTKIETSIQSINREIEDGEQSLAAEEKSLVLEITTLEKQLEEASSRLKHVRQQRREGSSRRTARLSSWQGALEDVEQKITRDVLEGRGLEEVIPDLRPGGTKSRSPNIWRLPRERRTIELINEDVARRISELEAKRDAAESEGLACEQAAGIWVSSIKTLEEFEQSLTDEMSKLSANRINADESNAEGGLIRVVENMAAVIDHFERELDIAESKGWNLLICIVGAEVEALKQGKDLLQDTLQMTRGESTTGTASMMTAKSRMASDLTDQESVLTAPLNGTVEQTDALQSVNDHDEPHEPASDSQDWRRNLNQQGQSTRARVDKTSVIDDEEDDDDAPPPTFLIEHDG